MDFLEHIWNNFVEGIPAEIVLTRRRAALYHARMTEPVELPETSSADGGGRKQKKFHPFTQSGGFKVAILVVLVLLLLIPVTMIRALVRERSFRAESAESSIMEAWGDRFVLYGPVIRIPVEERQETRTQTEKEGTRIDVNWIRQSLWLTPKDVTITADFSAQKKRRGIFSVALFSGDVSLNGSFTFERAKSSLLQNQTMFPEQAELVIALASQKGIRKIVKADWNGGELFFKPGNRGFPIAHGGYGGATPGDAGINASTPFDTEGVNTFDIQFSVQGGKSLRVLPAGELTVAKVRSDWPAPSFQGGFLPVKQALSETGFDAEWEISYLSRSIPLFWVAADNSGYDSNGGFSQELFGVDFYKALDHYALNERAVKYAILFLVIPFLTLFFLEIFSQKSIHPAQYLLSGLANVIFYLLLLSVSEHLSFSLAYLIASAALTAMMTFYARSLLESWTRSAYMGLVMALLYLILYLTLNAEDWALLIGSIAAFVITGIVMFLTRRLDWSSLRTR
ncbi:MAG: cell envelope integrity protein CreD [Treponemataceae bacterium]|nr:MAG: cell envelope integrity protein CreD [Treponemataceae bacterium]